MTEPVNSSETLLPPRRNIKLVIAYNGAAYHGWQRQREGFITVQQCVEEAAARVVRHPVITDANRSATKVTDNPLYKIIEFLRN